MQQLPTAMQLLKSAVLKMHATCFCTVSACPRATQPLCVRPCICIACCCSEVSRVLLLPGLCCPPVGLWVSDSDGLSLPRQAAAGSWCKRLVVVVERSCVYVSACGLGQAAHWSWARLPVYVHVQPMFSLLLCGPLACFDCFPWLGRV